MNNGKVPTHIAIIMDGNGRWAEQRGFPRLSGHQAGADSIRECIEVCGKIGVQYLTLYAFSSENWKRPSVEVKGLMDLLERFLRESIEEMIHQEVRLYAIGHLQDLPATCRHLLEKARERTASNRGITLVLALSYSSRMEIVDAARRIVQAVQDGQVDMDQIDDQLFGNYLYTQGIPDPDLLIRTSGEIRLSNFLLWQSSYTEIYVTSKLWPDFRAADLREALDEYGRRRRRYGKL
ncbi:MAG: isoprenyl transferase [Candidatus Xiphinematobacter sp.]|nr:MAG: isoprenyl transferase [Candidatus Xiphinematobacter sp.]QQY10034.1 MAG: isoprenyl transferase [Candidatus Xiphinematobacter sp.]QQY10766.1 MAG: isoprenyl transferase [Candidatus Xiphinematobacter sp.]QQY11512.1 MAG: isoprenyl transferase [Candidatus Xiphinematobacter sp.]